MPTTNSITKGLAISFKRQPWIVLSTQFTNPGKGQAFTKARMRNLKTGQVLENTFKSGESVELLDTIRKKCQYLYNDGSDYHFMDNETYEQFALNKDTIQDAEKFLIDGTECYALHIEGNPVSIQLPPKMDFKVTKTTPGVKGDTATGGSKDCTIETGTTIKVPLFIKEGETIKINTENGTYVSKA
jgi:elongation factor P